MVKVFLEFGPSFDALSEPMYCVNMLNNRNSVGLFCCAFVLFSLSLTTISEGASDDDNKDRVRRYDKRIQLYDVDLGRQTPQRTYDERGEAATSLGSSSEPRIDTTPTLPRNYNTPPAQPIKKEKKKNWILPPMSEDLKGDESKKDDKERSGWGWLADDMDSREVSRERKLDEEDEDRERKGRGRSDKRDDRYDSYQLDSTFEPVATESLFEDVDADDATSSTYRDARDAEEAAVKKALDERRRETTWNVDGSSEFSSQETSESTLWKSGVSDNRGNAPREERLTRTGKLLSGIAAPLTEQKRNFSWIGFVFGRWFWSRFVVALFAKRVEAGVRVSNRSGRLRSRWTIPG